MALLAKQGWRILSRQTSLLSRILKARYFPRSDLLEAKVGYNPSFTWRSIWAAIEVLKMGCRWRIGDGRQVRIWCLVTQTRSRGPEWLTWHHSRDG
ncbi:UNVERIFIED_CONTAM: putative mitochondrial protein [Sesamum latifolium]|uniref:Mitochondrial protein n=1 Tax=Sesamum latifolium TaxID=2727402 RepID=A0AAW2XVN3_9LAMI